MLTFYIYVTWILVRDLNEHMVITMCKIYLLLLHIYQSTDIFSAFWTSWAWCGYIHWPVLQGNVTTYVGNVVMPITNFIAVDVVNEGANWFWSDLQIFDELFILIAVISSGTSLALLDWLSMFTQSELSQILITACTCEPMLLTFDTLVSISFLSARTITRTSRNRFNLHVRTKCLHL